MVITLISNKIIYADIVIRNMKLSLLWIKKPNCTENLTFNVSVGGNHNPEFSGGCQRT